MSLLEVDGLVKRFGGRRGHDRPPAVDGVSFRVEAGRTLAIVGESGSGKSTVARLVLGLARADAGRITFDGVDLSSLSRRRLREQRQHLQMVFQDPYGSLDPRQTIGAAVTEPLRIFRRGNRSEREAAAVHELERVGLGRRYLDRRPHELSGGQLQRVSIARALTLRPKLIVCDEPVAALDVSVRAQVMNLLLDLQEDDGLAYLFITHDLGLLRGFAHEVMVMRRGVVEEHGSTDQVLDRPRSAYARELLADVPDLRTEVGDLAPEAASERGGRAVAQ